MSEAKSSLSRLFHAQTAAEKSNSVIKAFDEFEIAGLNRYVVGFSEKCRTADEVLNTLQLKQRKKMSDREVSFLPEVEAPATEFFNKIPCTEGFPDRWEIFAIGQPRTPDWPLDIWRIDQSKNLVQINADGTLRQQLFNQILAWGLVIAALLTAAFLWGFSRKIQLQLNGGRVARVMVAISAVVLTTALFFGVMKAVRQLLDS